MKKLVLVLLIALLSFSSYANKGKTQINEKFVAIKSEVKSAILQPQIINSGGDWDCTTTVTTFYWTNPDGSTYTTIVVKTTCVYNAE